jgi:hypothetical protein
MVAHHGLRREAHAACRPAIIADTRVSIFGNQSA